MKVLIQSESIKDINIKLPMSVVILMLRILKILPIQFDEKIDKTLKNIFESYDVDNLIKGLKYLKNHHKGLVLVDIDDSNGDKVRIEI